MKTSRFATEAIAQVFPCLRGRCYEPSRVSRSVFQEVEAEASGALPRKPASAAATRAWIHGSRPGAR